MGHQEQIGGVLRKQLVPKGDKKTPLGPKTRNKQVAAEMWRCFGGLERLSLSAKTSVLTALIDRGHRREDWHYWVMARLGARQLLYGPANAIIPGDAMGPLIHKLGRQVDAAPMRMGLLALTSLSRKTGLRAVDIADPVRTVVREVLASHDAPEIWREQLEQVLDLSEEERATLSADSLPLGVVLHTPDASTSEA